MKKIEAHKTVAAAALLVVVVCVVVYALALLPQIRSNREMREQAEKKEKELKELLDRRWELDPSYLGQLEKQYESHRRASMKRLTDVLQNANDEFRPLIDEHGTGDVKVYEWQAAVSLIDYQENFNNMKKNLAYQGIYLNDSYLGLSESTSLPDDQMQNTYRLLAQIYVVERLALLTRKHGLKLGDGDWRPANDDDWRPDPRRPVAMIRALPVRAYTIDSGEEPYLEEFPVELKVRGRINDLCRFLANLTDNGYFLPLERIVIKAAGVDAFSRPGYRYLTNEDIEVRLVCSGFLVLRDIEKLKQRKDKKLEKVQTYKRGA